MVKIIGRKLEQERLKNSLISGAPELIAVYGRRRVGKTFLIREFYRKHLVFEVTGLHKGSMSDQLDNFKKALSTKTSSANQDSPANWFEAFTLLENYLNTLKSVKRKVIFIDEYTSIINVAQYIYEWVTISLPMIRMHEDIADCDPDVIKKLNGSDSESDKDSIWTNLKNMNFEN